MGNFDTAAFQTTALLSPSRILLIIVLFYPISLLSGFTILCRLDSKAERSIETNTSENLQLTRQFSSIADSFIEGMIRDFTPKEKKPASRNLFHSYPSYLPQYQLYEIRNFLSKMTQFSPYLKSYLAKTKHVTDPNSRELQATHPLHVYKHENGARRTNTHNLLTKRVVENINKFMPIYTSNHASGPRRTSNINRLWTEKNSGFHYGQGNGSSVHSSLKITSPSFQSPAAAKIFSRQPNLTDSAFSKDLSQLLRVIADALEDSVAYSGNTNSMDAAKRNAETLHGLHFETSLEGQLAGSAGFLLGVLFANLREMLQSEEGRSAIAAASREFVNDLLELTLLKPYFSI